MSTIVTGRGTILGPERTVRAEVLAAMLTGAGPASSGGVAKLRLAGARVVGQLDLAFALVPTLLDFEHCWFDARFDISEATTGSIRFRGCFMDEFDASRATVGGELALQGCLINHLGLYGTPVGNLEISGTTIRAPGGIAVYGDLLVASAAVYCHDTVFHGQVRLPGARIGSYLRLNGATMTASNGAALYAPGLRVETGLFAGRSVEGQDDVLTCDGEIDLSSARISGPLDLREARLGALNLQGQRSRALCISTTASQPTTSTCAGCARLRSSTKAPPSRRNCGWKASCTTNSAHCRPSSPAWPDWPTVPFTPSPTNSWPPAIARWAATPKPAASCWPASGSAAGSRIPYRVCGGLLQDATTGYGYRPWLAGLWLAALLVVGSLYYADHRPPPLDANSAPHFNSVAYTLDLLIPVMNLGQTSAWNPGGFGQALSYALILCGWALSKLRITVSGCMRSMAGAQEFCAIRSCLAAAARHGITGLEALTSAFQGRPWIPETG